MFNIKESKVRVNDMDFDYISFGKGKKILVIIQGLNMGVISMTKKIEDYDKKADKDIIKLAKTFLKYQNENIELLKKY